MDKFSTGDEVPEVGVGMLGYALMGKAHTNAYKKIPYLLYPPPAIPILAAIAGRNLEAVEQAARQYGYRRAYTDWRAMLDDPNVALLDNGGPNNLHAEPCIRAAEMGKHVLCEKPLARSAEEAKEMLEAARKAGVKHMTGFNYRFVPAIRLAYEMIQSGALGKIYHYRAVYLHEGNIPHYNKPMSWRMEKEQSGSGSLGDLGSHIIDLGRFLVGEIKSVSALTRTFAPERLTRAGKPVMVDVDDAFVAIAEFESGAIGTLEASRMASGHKNGQVLEINAEKGSLRFDLERLNELQVFWVAEEPKETSGFHQVSVTERYHPWWPNWWPHGHIIGWEHTFVHEIAHLLDCIVNDREVKPYGADFEDGYRAAVVCDAVLESAASKRQVDIHY